MKQVTLTDFRQHLSKWLDEVSKGERLILTRKGEPVCAVVAPSDLEKIKALPKWAKQMLQAVERNSEPRRKK